VYNIVETPATTDIQSKSFLTDDPALIILYSQLRQKSLQTLRGASKVDPRVEWEFVLHNARLYDRMGCDLLGLELVRNWEFLKPSAGLPRGLGGGIDPIMLARRRSSMVVADLPVVPISATKSSEVKAGGQQQAIPAAFQEPDANSLLDIFGF
jgi:hypothetical protein